MYTEQMGSEKNYNAKVNVPVHAHFIHLWMWNHFTHSLIFKLKYAPISALSSHHNDPSTKNEHREKDKRNFSFWRTLIRIQLCCSFYSFSVHLFTFSFVFGNHENPYEWFGLRANDTNGMCLHWCEPGAKRKYSIFWTDRGQKRSFMAQFFLFRQGK